MIRRLVSFVLLATLVAATPSPAQTPVDSDVEFRIRVDHRSFAPDDGEVVMVSLCRKDEPVDGAVFVSARVYSISGELVRLLYKDRTYETPSVFLPGGTGNGGSWDGTDRRGEIVPGGIYIIEVDWGPAPGARTGSTRKAIVVVR